MFVSQAYSVGRFLWQYIIPVSVFAYCYGRIFHTIRRQRKVVAGHAGCSQDVPMATTSRDPNTGQVQQQATAAASGDKLSRTEMNVIKTMITIVVCFLIFWTASTIANLLQLLGVSICTSIEHNNNNNHIITINVFYLFIFIIMSLTSVGSMMGCLWSVALEPG